MLQRLASVIMIAGCAALQAFPAKQPKTLSKVLVYRAPNGSRGWSLNVTKLFKEFSEYA
jgi:hypothetical protein